MAAEKCLAERGARWRHKWTDQDSRKKYISDKKVKTAVLNVESVNKQGKSYHYQVYFENCEYTDVES